MNQRQCLYARSGEARRGGRAKDEGNDKAIGVYEFLFFIGHLRGCDSLSAFAYTALQHTAKGHVLAVMHNSNETTTVHDSSQNNAHPDCETIDIAPESHSY